MTVHLDHLMVPSRNKVASAKLLAELLGVPWSETGVGPFAPVYVNDGLTIDFDEWTTSTSSSSESRRLEYRTVAAFMGRSTFELIRSTVAASSTGMNQMVINGKC